MIVMLRIAILVLFIGSCSPSSEEASERSSIQQEPPRGMVGDILLDSLLDDPDFKLCGKDNRLVQYYALDEKTYDGEKWAIQNTFSTHYKVPIMDGETGLVRIRFIVNCNGETGRFRLMGMNPDYSKKAFNKTITDQLLKITKSLTGWKSFNRKSGRSIEYYQYLIFKLKDGQITEILP